MLSFGRSFLSTSSGGSNFNSVSSPPIIAPFWDDVDITKSGRIYYRQESDPTVAEQVLKDISSQYPEAEFFHPSLVFVATWDTVAAFRSDFLGLFNTFQVTVISNGTWTFVRFSYGDIQWGGTNTLIGVSAGDGVSFVTHPASLSSSVLFLDDTNVTYRIDSKLSSPSLSLVCAYAMKPVNTIQLVS